MIRVARAMALVAVLILVVHLVWLALVICGALWTRGRPVWSLLHILARVWGIVVEVSPWPCPLTLAEQYFPRARAKLTFVSGRFLAALPGRDRVPQSPLLGGSECGCSRMRSQSWNLLLSMAKVHTCSKSAALSHHRHWVWVFVLETPVPQNGDPGTLTTSADRLWCRRLSFEPGRAKLRALRRQSREASVFGNIDANTANQLRTHRKGSVPSGHGFSGKGSSS